MNRLNVFERNLNIISLGDKEVILREKSIYDLLTALDYLSIKDLKGFIDFVQNGLTDFGAIINNIDTYLNEFFLLHLPQENRQPETEQESEEDNYKKFVRSAIQLLLKFSEIWGIDPIEIAQKYTIRQLNDFARIIGKETKSEETPGKANNNGYKCYIDQYGRKVEEWEEVI